MVDGAMGTLIQGHQLGEDGYRGTRYADHGHDLKGDSDVLSLTQPEIIREIHRAYFAADADIVCTNTFTASSISQADYGLEADCYELNRAAAVLAREAADEASTPERPRYVAGSLGPTNRTASISPDVNDPGARNVSFDELVESYVEEARGLVDGGVDLLLVETVFDTLNAKAAIFALETLFDELGRRWPVWISGTITDASGRTLSGQTTEAFWNSVRHVRPLLIGLNCALGASDLRPYVAELSRIADCFVAAHPNAGLPNEFGEYDETPDQMAAVLGDFATSGLVNLIGGCCGTTPEHIAAIARAAKGADASGQGGDRPGHAALRPRAVHHRRGQPVRQRRRADQHHRLGPVPDADQGRRLRHRAVGRRPAGGQRRAGHRRQHGRGHDRRRRGDGPVPQARRERAGHQPRPRDGRLLEVGGDRGRPQVRAGQGDRQLHLPQGGRGAVPRARQAVPPLRCRRRGDGVRRGRPGRLARTAAGHLPARLPDPHRGGRVPGRGHHLRPERLRRRHRHRGARDLRRRLHRGHPLDQAAPARCAGLRGHLQRQLLVPRQQPGAGGDPRRLPVPRDPGRPRPRDRERRGAGGLRPGRRRAP